MEQRRQSLSETSKEFLSLPGSYLLCCYSFNSIAGPMDIREHTFIGTMDCSATIWVRSGQGMGHTTRDGSKYIRLSPVVCLTEEWGLVDRAGGFYPLGGLEGG